MATRKPAKEEQIVPRPNEIGLLEFRVHNFVAFDEKVFRLNERGVTTFYGSNGTGKSSIIQALIALRGGIRAEMVRRGADGEPVGDSEIVWVLSDQSTVERRRTGAGPELKVTVPGIGDLNHGKEYVEGIIDEISINPLKLLTAKPQDQLSALLECVELDLSADDLRWAFGGAESVTPKLPKVADLVDRARRTNAIEVLDMARSQVYDLRTKVNVKADEKDKHAKQLKESLGPDETSDWPAEVGRINGELGEIRSSIKSAEAIAETLRQGEVGEAQRERDKAKADAKSERDRIVAAAEAAYVQSVADAEAAYRARVADAQSEMERNLNDALREKIERREQLQRELGGAEAKASRQAEQTVVRRHLNEAREEAIELHTEADAYTATIKRLDELRGKLLSQFPIPGLDFKEGEIWLDGLPFNQINTAKRVAFVIHLAVRRRGPLGLVVADNLECLDGATFSELCRAAAEIEPPMQFVLTRVVDDKEFVPLTQDESGTFSSTTDTGSGDH